MLGEKIAATKSMQTYHISTFVRTIQHQSQGVQLHGHGDLDQVGEHDDKVKLVVAESKLNRRWRQASFSRFNSCTF
jgi:hypothetical protein